MKIASTNSSRNYEVIGEVEAAAEHDVQAAVAKAHASQPAWAALSQAERNQAVLSLVATFKRHAEEIAVLVSKEIGMPIARSRTRQDRN
jgi:acyl-CoA reductase-like NAD-dependent aldehyde dehydrogenase